MERKTVKLTLSSSLEKKSLELINELKENGFLIEDEIRYTSDQEAILKDIFNKHAPLNIIEQLKKQL